MLSRQNEFMVWLLAEITKKNKGVELEKAEIRDILHLSGIGTWNSWLYGATVVNKLAVHFLCNSFGLDWDKVRTKAEKLIDHPKWAKEKERSDTLGLQKKRDELKLSSIEIADKLGISRQWYWNLENGEVKASKRLQEKIQEL